MKNYNNELKNINQETSMKSANLSQEVELIKKDRDELTKTLHNYIKELEQKVTNHEILIIFYEFFFPCFISF